MSSSTTSVSTGGVLRSLVSTSRPLSWVNTAYPFAVALFLTTGRIDLPLVIGTLFFLIPYNLAMYGINDVFDYESDLLNPRKGGVEGAVVDRRHHRTILVACAVTCIPFLVYLYAVGTVASAIALTVTMFAVVAYSAKGLRFKEVPFLDSATSATHFVGPAVVGALLADGRLGASTVLVLAAFFAWSMASQAFGAVQDVIADRAAGLGSISTVLGAKATVRVALGLYALAAILLLVPWELFSLGALLMLPYLANIWPFRSLRDEDAERANAGWRRFLWLNYVTGFLVTMLIIAQVQFG
ncbi:prenyltransferase [Brachybacterium muris]|uniref:Prenyltransferase n=1 Tax=Brachybacterium muris UCD-AY4 TaxID=1249481 RepID=A0A022KU84_9MICO|nr:prenyltransferase [Brachybacterium muris]EYT49643.1 prenyltransferase [Brachybacterium muris UCD-AY4]MBM7499588.1 4-hydroxybenzoate polyprenyltransferase [Brachybacterium muris]MCT1654585.1 prenyltransferase [Brachybacterium muris]MCT1997181.1 prenyltransferase [Brachybacterium muris]MCT2177111.1 prenyltransferase [Brachybacterium muris]